MKDKIKRYVDSLLTDIYDTKQLVELKEEISANLLEKINDYIAGGISEEVAFQKAVANLGDMNELIDNLRKASAKKTGEFSFKTFPLSRKQVLGYISASTIFLFGVMTGVLAYFSQKDLLIAFESFLPFLLVSVPIYAYFGLIQETRHHYGMNSKRALAYTAAGELLLFGLGTSGILYFLGKDLLIVFSALMPFLIISIVFFLYLGLTEKKRRKMGPGWEKQWIEYYSNPRTMILRGTISGSLWIFSIAAFFIIAFSLGWQYSWIVFVAAIGLEMLIEAYFAAKRKDK